MPNAPFAVSEQSGASRSAVQKLAAEDDIYSDRIGLDYRALAVLKKDRVIWYWIGSHSELPLGLVHVYY